MTNARAEPGCAPMPRPRTQGLGETSGRGRGRPHRGAGRNGRGQPLGSPHAGLPGLMDARWRREKEGADALAAA
jgi:hypothetical protein